LIVATVWEFTTEVDAVKFAVVFPAGTVTEAGTVAAEELLVNATTAPPDGATPLSVTVPVEESPFQTVVGLRLIDPRIVGWTVRFADTVFARVAVIVAVD